MRFGHTHGAADERPDAPPSDVCPHQDDVFDEQRFRHELGRFATGVVLISCGSGDMLHAMTANAFMSGSLRPPLIVVSVAH